MSSVGVVGGSLVGMSVAARLARVGHQVTLFEAKPRLGSRWAHAETWGGSVLLPAAWRDLFSKTGQPLQATLERRGLTLAPAPDPVHVLPGGRRLTLPTDRDAQLAAMTDALGSDAALAWRDLLDSLDESWQRLRPLGLEADEELTPDAWRAFEPRRSVAELATQLPEPVGQLLIDAVGPDDPRDVPGWAALGPAVERMFGRWRVVSATDEIPVSPTVLVGLLAERLEECDVHVLTSTRVESRIATAVTTSTVHAFDAVVDTTSPWSGLERPPRSLEPAVCPERHLEEADGPEPDTLDHETGLITSTFSDGERWVRVVTDLRRKNVEPGAGVSWDGPKSWRKRPPLVGDDGLVRASTASRAGGEPWAQLLTGALAAAAVHERLTGESIRPVDDPRRQHQD